MKILILEDEEQALQRLQKIVSIVIPGYESAGTVSSIEEAVAWFDRNPMPDLVFMDIQLADGNSFQLFSLVTITCPVIFTTAYESYALQAFKVNSVDYLLKPIDEDDVRRAVEKLKLLQRSGSFSVNYAQILQNIPQAGKQYKDRFIIRLGDTIRSIRVTDIAYFYTENKTNFLCANEGKRFPMDFNLDQVEQMLNPKNFFRINRQFIIGHHAIDEMKAHTRSRINVKLSPPTPLDTIVAIDRAHDFKNWLSE
ncbi:MAG TPA: LytTR family DNA-binding domain-containing protein [Ferruginibacter sp.]|nr:DNA-binding response regulator [Chitinophagaceae bacterium]HRI23097.1 LytTR family DNA-binding domain-containing protein [Ferruginibacter sp.]